MKLWPRLSRTWLTLQNKGMLMPGLCWNTFVGLPKRSPPLSPALALMKSFWPKTDVRSLASGVAVDCSNEKLAEYLQEVKPMALKT